MFSIKSEVPLTLAAKLPSHKKSVIFLYPTTKIIVFKKKKAKIWKASTLKYYLTLVLGDNFLVIYLHLAQLGHKGTTSVLRNQSLKFFPKLSYREVDSEEQLRSMEENRLVLAFFFFLTLSDPVKKKSKDHKLYIKNCSCSPQRCLRPPPATVQWAKYFLCDSLVLLWWLVPQSHCLPPS